MRILLLAIAATLLFAAGASAALPPLRSPARPPTPTATPTATPVTPASSTGSANSGGVLGTPEQLQQTDVSCKSQAGATPEVRANCAADGQPQSAYPSSNYGLDVHVDTGITDPGGDVSSIFQTLLSAIFQGIAMFISAVLGILGFAFKFDLFRSGYAAISHAMSVAFGGWTLKLLPLSFVVLAIVLIKFIFQRQEGRVISHALFAILLIGVGFVLISNPVGTLGDVDSFATQLSGAAVGMFNGSGGGTGYADSEPALWKVSIETPWCVAEFGNERWCNQPPDAAMKAARANIIAHHLPQALGDQASSQEATQQAPLETKRLNEAKTNGEMFLSFVTNADARNGKNDPWTFYNVVAKEQPDLLSIRGGGGWIHRGLDLFFGSIVGVMFLILLGYIALQLLVNEFIIVGSLLGLPIAVLLPVTEGGQRSFVKYLSWIGLAFLRKVVYSLYLGIVILLASVVGAIAAGEGVIIYWFLLAVTFGAAFHLRHKPMELGGLQSYPTPGSDMWEKYRKQRSGGRGYVPAPSEEVYNSYEHHHGDTYYQHAHVYGETGGSRPAPREHASGAIEGEARELTER